MPSPTIGLVPVEVPVVGSKPVWPGRHLSSRRARLVVTVLGAAACVATAVPAGASAHGDAAARSSSATRVAGQAAAAPTYTNPVTAGYSIDFPDPTMMRGKDGYWYAYGTGGPYDETGRSDNSKMARSRDMTHWQSLGAVFGPSNTPTWAAAGTGFWAFDIRYLDGHYVMYFVVPNSTVSTTTFDPGIGVATAPTPGGPWTDSGAPLVPPRKDAAGNWTTVIDPSEFTDDNGQHYLYYGGFDSGDFVVPLSADGLHLTGPGKQVASSRFEGPYVVKHGGWYYFFGSSANCCAGPTTGYTVFTGRSRSPFGPFLDRQRQPLLASNTGGSIVIAPNGNAWVGTGGNAMVTDLSGQDYLVYHAVLRRHPYLDTAPGFTMRPMLIDRLDWIDGWPTVRGGRGASDTPQPSPVTGGIVADDFNTPGVPVPLRPTSGRLTLYRSDPASDVGGFVRLIGRQATALVTRAVPRDERVQADIRTQDAVGLTVRTSAFRGQIQVVANAKQRRLQVVATVFGRRIVLCSAPVAPDVDMSAWHTLTVDTRGTTLSAAYSDSNMSDPEATIGPVTVPPLLVGRPTAGIVATGSGDADNFSVNRLFIPHTAVITHPRPRRELPAYSDNFDGRLGAGWSWVRKDDAARVVGDQLTWPTEDADLSNGNSTAGVLLRAAPIGNYIIQTKLQLNLGVDINRNYQQAGLVVYVDDHHLLRFDHVATGPVRISEFGKRDVVDGVDSFGGAIIGPPATTMWLRIAKSTNRANGEQDYQAASSRDGRHWIYGATWTLPAGSTPRIGLVSEGSLPSTDAAYGKALAKFAYFRVFSD